jgi:glutamate dehydrogenase
MDTTKHSGGDFIDQILQATTPEAGPFARLLYGNATPADLVLSDTPADIANPAKIAALGQLASDLWDFAAEREPGHAKLRIVVQQQDGGIAGRKGAIIAEIINDDMPFLVDSVIPALNRARLSVDLILHPVALFERDDSGQRIAFGRGKPESVILISLSSSSDMVDIDAIEADLTRTLNDVRAAVADWRPMLARLDETVAKLGQSGVEVTEEIAETQAFLRWLGNQFVFLGYREYRFVTEKGEAAMQVVDGSGLGILRDPKVVVFDNTRNLSSLPPEIRAYLERPDPLLVAKSNDTSRVHRAVQMDVIGVKQLDAHGKVIAERRFIGLFTAHAYGVSVHEVPVLRRKVSAVLQRAGLNPAGHDGKALAEIVENYPRDELFLIDPDDLFKTAMGILRLQERRRVALFVRRDPFERFVSCLVFVPQERYSFMLRQKLQSILEEVYDGHVITATAQIYDSPLARIHIIIGTTRGAVPQPDVATLEAVLAEVARSWDDRLTDIARQRGAQAEAAARRLAGAFTSAYVETIPPNEAINDIIKLDEATAEAPALTLYQPDPSKPAELGFKIYRPGQSVPLSDVLPMLENLGLRVLAEKSWMVRPKGSDERLWIHDFTTQFQGGDSLDITAAAARFEEGFLMTWRGMAEDDGFNRLILTAGLTAREAALWRAYAKYLRQVGFTFSQTYIEDTLSKHAQITGLLTLLFHARLDPDRVDATMEVSLRAEIEHALDAVTVLDEDRILRRLVNLVAGTLRTNFYQPDASGAAKSYISFKLNSGSLDDLPKPVPFVEIWVYSPSVEAIHLRGGPVARGGIRWSDRREDFRTEILGLIKAQMVKNAVIVPVGSKGGFVPKRLPPASAGRAAQQQEVIASYRTLMSGMLDITDNRVGTAIVHPPRVIRHDGDDPYLVVAADKGTATFSDIANGISQEYGFWLDDAFASGGSVGYDHKALGITARGAWVAVERHFLKTGVNPNTDPITVIGIGDMAGDVFGNGMLRSSSMKLIGAFNHMHIFIDPTPNPAQSFAMRQKLFTTPGTSWADYDKAVISQGGGVFERSAKSLTLSPEIKALFGITEDHVTPAELIRAMLRAEVDLLWFGGIGTYVKAASESNAEAGDRANDALRIDGHELRAKVVGEGANLGVTQKGRIEFAATGGRINTDAIDNSAGVDMSDHEVNIKILLGDPVQHKVMTTPERNILLAEMANEVSDQVLRDNYLQALALSAAEAEGADLVEAATRLMERLEHAAGLDRGIEYLPSNAGLATRRAAGLGLYRPEMAVLLAFAKMAVYNALLPSDLPDDPALSDDLTTYFPSALHQRFATEIARHGLKREIVATVLTNQIINRGGLTFVSELERDSGKSIPAIVRGFAIARSLLKLPPLWTAIEALDGKASSAGQITLYRAVSRAVYRTVAWLVQQPLPSSIGAAIGILDDKLTRLEHALPEPQGLADLPGVPADLVRRVRRLEELADTLAVVGVADAAGVAIDRAADAYFDAGARFGIETLRGLASGIATPDGWSREALTGLLGDLSRHQQHLAAKLIAQGEAWLGAKSESQARLSRLLGELQAAGAPDLARLAVAERAVRELV